MSAEIRTEIRVLMVEDSDDDALMARQALESEGWSVHCARVDTDVALAEALAREPWDVVLLDYVMPQFSPLTALQIVRRADPDIPCIIVSGEITDETVVEAMKAGALDFVTKDSLVRLPQVVLRERNAAAARRLARENGIRLQAIFQTAVDGIVTIDEQGTITSINPAALAMFGYAAEEVLGQNVSILAPEPHHSAHQGYIERYLRTGEAHIIGIGREVDARRKDGSTFPIRLSVSEAHPRSGRMFVGVIHDITDLKQAEGERERLSWQREEAYEAEQQARAEAEDANRAKDEFLALVSHELRNPLNAISAGVHLLRQYCPVEGRAAQTMAIVERNAALQIRLISDLLDLSRLQRGRLALQRASLDLARVVGPSCRAAEPDAVAAGLTLSCHAEQDVWVIGDGDRLQQVVANLVGNAIKFTPPPGRVEVELSRAECGPGDGGGDGPAGDATDPCARITVTDTGMGISPELRPHLFEMFRQGEIASRRAAGLGLGLALVRGIVEQHGGRVWAESEGIGKGSRFIVDIPLVPGPALMAPHCSGEDLGRRPRLLLVEDSPDTRVVIDSALTLAGYDVSSVASAEDALAVLKEMAPDLMLVDIGLPGIDGVKFLGRARRLPGFEHVPAFAVTGYGSEQDVRRTRDAGFEAHFVKPVQVDALLRAIEEWLGRSAAQPTTGA